MVNSIVTQFPAVRASRPLSRGHSFAVLGTGFARTTNSDFRLVTRHLSLFTALPEPVKDRKEDQTERHVDQNGAGPIKQQERRRGFQQGVLEGGHAKIVN
jgi:hypothetical protein